MTSWWMYLFKFVTTRNLGQNLQDIGDLLNGKSDDQITDSSKPRIVKYRTMSLDQLAKSISLDTDRLILDTEKQDQITFVGGDLIISLHKMKQDCFSEDLKLYFHDARQKVIAKEVHKELEWSLLNSDAQLELKEKKQVSYECNHPKCS